MSCKACEKAQGKSIVYMYRWITANIAIKCCKKHVEEIFDVLNNAQGLKPDPETKQCPYRKDINCLADESCDGCLHVKETN